MLTIPGDNRDDAVTLLWDCFPVQGRRGRRFVSHVKLTPECSEKFEVRDEFLCLEGAKIILRHVLEMRFKFVRKIGRKFFCDGLPNSLSLHFGLSDELFLVL